MAHRLWIVTQNEVNLFLNHPEQYFPSSDACSNLVKIQIFHSLVQVGPEVLYFLFALSDMDAADLGTNLSSKD